MELKKDAFGQEIWAYYRDRDSFEIVERDDGYFAISGGAKSYFAEFNEWPKHEKLAMDYVTGRVLDIGCGAGRNSLYLQKKKYSVMGIDNSPLAIKVCKLRGLKKARVMSIEEINFFQPKSFDTILMLGNNFGLLQSSHKAKKLLKKIYHLTSDEAIIIAESNNPYLTANPAHLSYHRLNRRRKRLPGQLKIRVRFEKYVGQWFDHLMVSSDEMEKIIQDTGWKIKKIISSKKSAYIAIIEKRNK